MGKSRFFRKVMTSDHTLNTLQTNIEQAVGEVIRSPLLDGALIDATLASGANTVLHKLDREIVGWIVVDRNSAATIYKTSSNSTDLVLTASAACTVKLWIF